MELTPSQPEASLGVSIVQLPSAVAAASRASPSVRCADGELQEFPVPSDTGSVGHLRNRPARLSRIAAAIERTFIIGNVPRRLRLLVVRGPGPGFGAGGAGAAGGGGGGGAHVGGTETADGGVGTGGGGATLETDEFESPSSVPSGQDGSGLAWTEPPDRGL